MSVELCTCNKYLAVLNVAAVKLSSVKVVVAVELADPTSIPATSSICSFCGGLVSCIPILFACNLVVALSVGITWVPVNVWFKAPASILAAVTASAASSVVSTLPATILAVVTELSANFVCVTVPLASLDVVTCKFPKCIVSILPLTSNYC